MKDSKLNSKILIVMGILTAISCAIAFTSSQTAAKVQKSLDVERYNRMTAEEKLEKVSGKLVSLQDQLDTANTKIQNVQAVLSEGKTSTDELKAQLDDLSRTKEALEKQIADMKSAQTAATEAGSR